MNMHINMMPMGTVQVAQPLAMDALLEPPTGSVRHYSQPAHDLALQKYLLLQEQHELLHQHLEELRPLCTPVSHSPPSPPASPTRRQHQRSSFSLPTRKSSCASTTSSGGSAAQYAPEVEVAIEEAKLCDVNEGLKRALTELLNSERGRADHVFRTWVQCRLLDTERELRNRRRRRSAPGP